MQSGKGLTRGEPLLSLKSGDAMQSLTIGEPLLRDAFKNVLAEFVR